MQEAIAYIRKHHMISAGDCIIVGVSGGADSVCLLFVLLEYQKEVDFTIKVVHIEHGIRGEDSLKDAEFVGNLCREYKVPFTCVHGDIPVLARERKMTMEEAGRSFRYETFEKCLREFHGNKIAVAHNQNDQAETMLMNMVRGSGLKGISGIRPVRGPIIRPLLSTSRRSIETWLNERDVTWREDATNQEEEYARNRIRNQILPLMAENLNPAVMEHFFALSEELQETEKYLNQKSREAFAKCVKVKEQTAEVCIDEFLKTEEFLQSRVIRLCLQEAGCGLKDITREHIEKIQGLTTMESGKQIMLPGGWKAERAFQNIMIHPFHEKEILNEASLVIGGITPFGKGRFVSRVFAYENQQIPQKRYTKWLNYDNIKDNLAVRTRKTGDYLVVNSQGGKKKLKNYFTDEKIPVAARDSLPLICKGQEVLWTVGYRISESGRVLPDTRQILEIIYEEDI